MLNDLLTIVIWCVGVAAMAATAWIQDRRDIRREQGEAKIMRDAFEERMGRLEDEVRDLRRKMRPKGEDDSYG